MTNSSLELFLSRRFGFDPGTLGPKAVEEALRARMTARKIQSVAEYIHILTHDPDEPQAMVERLVIPETWFFRYPGSFEHMTSFFHTTWFKRYPSAKPRILSVPCSTGEEPYTIAMAMIDSGIPAQKVQIDAVDISKNSLNIARKAVYGRNSFRGNDLSFRDRHFTAAREDFQVKTEVRDCVRLIADNLLSPGFAERHGVYDIVFCRNLLIYFDEASRKQAADVLSRVLNRTGVMYLGHAENMAMVDLGFSLLDGPHAFACVRPDAELAPGMVIKSSHRSRIERSKSGSGMSANAGSAMGSASGNSTSRPAIGDVSLSKTGALGLSKPNPASGAKPPRDARLSSSAIFALPVNPPATSDQSRGPAPAQPSTKEHSHQSRVAAVPPRAATERTATEAQQAKPAMSPLDQVRLMADQGMIKQALESCQKILREQGPSADVLCMLGILHQAHGQNADAESAFNKALYLNHQHYDALLHLSLLYEKVGEERMAENLMRRAKRVGKK